MTRAVLTLIVAWLSLAGTAAAQPAPRKTGPSPPAAEPWSFTASAYTFIVPEGSDYVMPTATADRGRLHLEGRYNYEGQKTGSIWAGVNLSGGSTVSWEFTPIGGVVFGQTDGVAPGYKGSISWRALTAYSESEYVFDTAESSDSFLYNWSEFTVAPTEAFRVGLVVQRTRAYKTDRDVQRGLIVGYAYRRAEFTACLFNPDDDKPTFAFSVGVRF